MTWPKSCIALVAGLLLTGCAAGGSDYSQYIQLVKQSFHNGFGKSGVTLQQAAAIPYASMGWRLNGGNQNIIVLATDSAQGQLWTSASHIVLLTDNGRIKRTVGLPHDIAALTRDGNGPVIPPAAALKAPYAEQWLADFPDQGSYATPLVCNGAARGRFLVTILGKKIGTERVDEVCEAPTLNWQFTNSYWVDPDNGLVWRSVQHIHPQGDTLETEIFRPPG